MRIISQGEAERMQSQETEDRPTAKIPGNPWPWENSGDSGVVLQCLDTPVAISDLLHQWPGRNMGTEQELRKLTQRESEWQSPKMPMQEQDTFQDPDLHHCHIGCQFMY